MASISVDVDIDDILWDMTSYEKQELANDLYDDGYVPTQLSGGVVEHQKNIMDLDWDDLVGKMARIRLQMSKEDEETISNILNKY
jgi:hypothetical protein